jgi:thiamine biosynthesis protein ThiS
VDVTVNGERREVAEGTTVGGLVALLGLPRERVAVERNRDVVRRAEWDAVALEEGDVLEVVHFVGGG